MSPSEYEINGLKYRSGLIMYRHVLEEAALLQNGQNILNITAPVHDYAKVSFSRDGNLFCVSGVIDSISSAD